LVASKGLRRTGISIILCADVQFAREIDMQRHADKRAIAIAAQEQASTRRPVLAAYLLLLPAALLLLLISPW
jgi:hypothetical protein